jgi:hypothetical protein
MKFSVFSKVMTAMTAMLLATAAYAAAGAIHKGSLQVSEPIQVNGKQLPPGEYTVTWEGEGPDASLHILNGKKEVASAPCKVVVLDKKASRDATESKSSSTGSRELTGVRFSGQKYKLQIPDTTSRADIESGTSVK